MPIRTVKFTGIAFSDTNSINIQATFNNQAIFNGNVNVPSTEGTDIQELFTFDIDQTINGNIPLTFTVTGGTIKFVDCLMNYTSNADFVDSNGDTVNVGTDFTINSSDMKSNISIDGNAYEVTHTPEESGSWHVEVLDGSTLTCDIVTIATQTS